ncbi:hypothetical protein ZWY2020_003620 [Hordeum vulgare]|nr:hypothetical protein ZWY2020_003620 [Hordeum vulgare]
MEHYPPLARSRFPSETWTHGEPDLRRERGGGIISRTMGMDALEADFHGRALVATVRGRRSVVSPEVMGRALSMQCGVDRSQVRVDVTHPADFFMTFASMEICDRVFACSGWFRYGGESVGFQRWHRSALASSGCLELFYKLGIEG